ncbi:MAG: NADH-quinone oxidoreductase subunit NuoN [Rhizobiales bacterium]|nr:NADH-quinone oxidoreductase subunit NuoN [Hyphomicrobiales bacterium]
MNFDPANLASYAPFLPEIILVAGALLILMLGVFAPKPRDGALLTLAVVVLLAAAAVVLAQPAGKTVLFGGAFVGDSFARFMKVLVLLGAALTLVMSFEALEDARILTFELAALVLLSVTGMLVMVSAGTLIALYLGLEMQSLALYVIAAARRDSARSGEAGLKYFVLGALSSGLLLYGSSLVYGFTGTTEFGAIASQLQSGGAGIGLIFGLVFVLAGLAFKVSAVPFHMWTPDVYEGAPTPVTAFFAAAPKIAAMALLARVVLTAFPSITPQWQQVLVFLSIASMAWGAFAAIGQTNIKRLMAYSSIGHMGFALVGLAAASPEGAKSVAIYLAIYLVMTLGAFACILSMRRANGSVEEVSELAGLAQSNPPMAFLLAVLLFSLAGIPPLAGFFAKFYVFLAAVNAGLYPLAILGVLASVVGAYYYLNIVRLMFFEEPVERFEPMANGARVVLGASGLFTLLFVFVPAPLVAAAEAAAKSLF